VHGYIYQVGYPYWSFYGIPGTSYGAAGEWWYDYPCCCLADGVTPYTCSAYYYYTTTYPYLTERSIGSTPSCYGNEEGWRWFGW